jgi:hypothetical protein
MSARIAVVFFFCDRLLSLFLMRATNLDDFSTTAVDILLTVQPLVSVFAIFIIVCVVVAYLIHVFLFIRYKVLGAKKTAEEESSQPKGLLPDSVCLTAKLRQTGSPSNAIRKQAFRLRALLLRRFFCAAESNGFRVLWITASVVLGPLVWPVWWLMHRSAAKPPYSVHHSDDDDDLP